MGSSGLLDDYDMDMARHLVQGVDIWLNTPRRPREASGTSGMKAGMNGTLNLSVLDGWWAEGYNGKNGWAIGDDITTTTRTFKTKPTLSVSTRHSRTKLYRFTIQSALLMVCQGLD